MVATIRRFIRASPPGQPMPTVRPDDCLLHLRMLPTAPSCFRPHSESHAKEIAMKTYRALAVSLAPSLGFAANAMAATVASDSARLSSQYSEWAGGRSNADALITGLHGGSPITIVTPGPNNT